MVLLIIKELKNSAGVEHPLPLTGSCNSKIRTIEPSNLKLRPALLSTQIFRFQKQFEFWSIQCTLSTLIKRPVLSSQSISSISVSQPNNFFRYNFYSIIRISMVGMRESEKSRAPVAWLRCGIEITVVEWKLGFEWGMQVGFWVDLIGNFCHFCIRITKKPTSDNCKNL